MFHAVNGPVAHALAFGLESLYAYKLFGVNVYRFTDGVVASKVDLETWKWFVCHEQQFALRVVADIVLLALGSFEHETLDIQISLLVGVKEHSCPHFGRIKLLYAEDVVFIMVVGIEVGQVKIAVVEDDENVVIFVEFAEQLSVLIIVETLHVGVKPHFSSTQCAVTMAFQRNPVYVEACEQGALCTAVLDHHFSKVALLEDVLQSWSRVERHLDDFSLTIGVSRKVGDARARRALCDVVFPVAGAAGHKEPLHVEFAHLAVAVHHIINGTLVVFLEHRHMEHILADEYLVGHFGYLVFSVTIEDDDVVDVGAVAHKFILFQ